MKELILVRHGESVYMVRGLTGGWTDTPLTDKGKKQAHLTGRALQYVIDPFDFYCSNLQRAAQTAQIIGEALLKQPIFVPELREHNNGIAVNCTREKADKIRHPITEPIMDWIPYPGAESWRNLHTRVTTFMDSIQSQNDLIVIVAHSMVIVSIIHWWLNFTEDIITSVSYDIDPCSITRLTINSWGEKTISKLNDTGHLVM